MRNPLLLSLLPLVVPVSLKGSAAIAGGAVHVAPPSKIVIGAKRGAGVGAGAAAGVGSIALNPDADDGAHGDFDPDDDPLLDKAIDIVVQGSSTDLDAGVFLPRQCEDYEKKPEQGEDSPEGFHSRRNRPFPLAAGLGLPSEIRRR